MTPTIEPGIVDIEEKVANEEAFKRDEQEGRNIIGMRYVYVRGVRYGPYKTDDELAEATFDLYITTDAHITCRISGDPYNVVEIPVGINRIERK
jgi:hypothetical protein